MGRGTILAQLLDGFPLSSRIIQEDPVALVPQAVLAAHLQNRAAQEALVVLAALLPDRSGREALVVPETLDQAAQEGLAAPVVLDVQGGPVAHPVLGVPAASARALDRSPVWR